jgi:hypothetical protein
MVEQDEPISALGAASLPLTGNEKVVLVQNGVTKQTDIDNLPQPGGQLNTNELAAIQNANLPTGLNPFATLNDLSGSNFPTAIQYNTYEKGVSDVIAVMPWYIVRGAAPTATDDNTKGFRVGAMWQNSVTGIEYKNISNAETAAVWIVAKPYSLWKQIELGFEYPNGAPLTITIPANTFSKKGDCIKINGFYKNNAVGFAALKLKVDLGGTVAMEAGDDLLVSQGSFTCYIYAKDDLTGYSCYYELSSSTGVTVGLNDLFFGDNKERTVDFTTVLNLEISCGASPGDSEFNVLDVNFIPA